MPDALDGFERTSFTAEGTTRTVYRTGSGPAVVVCSELPGITPQVATFARTVAASGLTAVMPHLFGHDGRPPSVSYTIGSLTSACISREFTVLATGKTSPVTTWLRALAAEEHRRCGGPGVGAVGMCFTGGFALAMMVDDVIVAPVLSQPSLPFPISRRRRFDLGISPADAARVRERAASGTCVLGLRFSGDRTSPRALRPSPPVARRRVRRSRTRLLRRQPSRAQVDGPLGAHRGSRRPAGYTDPRGARPSPRLLRRASPPVSGDAALTGPAADWAARGTSRTLCEREIFTVDVAPRGRDTAPPLLVLHGFPTSSFDFHLVVDELAAARRVLLFDMVGYGLSEKPDIAYRLDMQADVAMALTAALGIDRLSLLTHDMGDTVGGELLARQLEGGWDVEIVDRILTNGSIYIELAHLTRVNNCSSRFPTRYSSRSRLPTGPDFWPGWPRRSARRATSTKPSSTRTGSSSRTAGATASSLGPSATSRSAVDTRIATRAPSSAIHRRSPSCGDATIRSRWSRWSSGSALRVPTQRSASSTASGTT